MLRNPGPQKTTMLRDARRQRELIAALRLESVFDAAQLGYTEAEEAGSAKPTPAETQPALVTSAHGEDSFRRHVVPG